MKFWMYMLLVTLTIIIGFAAIPIGGLIVLMEAITPGTFFQVIQDPETALRVMFDMAYCGLLTLEISVPLSIVTVAMCYLVRELIKRTSNPKNSND